MSGRDVDAVTFDFWDTLLHAPRPGDARVERSERVRRALAELDHALELERIAAAVERVQQAHTERWHANEQFTGVDGTELLLDLLEIELHAEAQALVVDALTGAVDGPFPDLTPNVRETLTILKDSGIRIGIICDVGLAPSTLLRSHLERHGVLAMFDHWSFSDDVGWYKPAPEIFAHALAGLGDVAPERAVHIGDLRRTDVAGARGAGITAVRYRGANDDAPGADEHPEADHVLDDHADLPHLLRLT